MINLQKPQVNVSILSSCGTDSQRDIDRYIPIHPEYVASVPDEKPAEDTVLTVDTGTCTVWATRRLSPNGPRRVTDQCMRWALRTGPNALTDRA